MRFDMDLAGKYMKSRKCCWRLLLFLLTVSVFLWVIFNEKVSAEFVGFFAFFEWAFDCENRRWILSEGLVEEL